jgi:hypothetical protein
MKNWALSLIIAICMVAVAGLISCSSLQTQHQKIAAACEGAASAADSIVAGVDSGRITAAQAKEARDVYRVTVPFCEPEPVASLGSDDYAALVAAAAQLAALSENAK